MPTTEEPERFFTVTLSEGQHRLIEELIRGMSAGDPDAEQENEDLLGAFLGSTEEVR